jgi:peptidoglycan/LPS O-acetylase OafA/YrhL
MSNGKEVHDPGRLLALDAMRGLAAIVVMGFHINRDLIQNGHLAVDFFFLLSGFVITRAYSSKLALGMSLGSFARLRFLRLFPLFAAGALIGLVTRAAGTVNSDVLSPDQLAVSAVFNLLMLPSPYTSLYTFPLNSPGWSLFFEFSVNLLFAGVLVKASTRTLWVVLALSAAWLASTLVHYGTLDVGIDWATFGGGIARTIFSFTAGVIVARLHSQPQAVNRISLALLLALVGLLFARFDGHARMAYELVVVMIASPLLVWLGASYSPPRALHRVSEWLGNISYPLYAIHLPMLLWFTYEGPAMGLSGRAWRLAYIASAFLAAWALGAYFDVPARAWLSRRLLPARVTAPA